MKKRNPYDERYSREGYYWSRTPAFTCRKAVEFAHLITDRKPLLVDIGCGDGGNTVYLARNGFDVIGLEVSKPGIEKTERYARESGVHVETVHADMVDYQPDRTYDVVYSAGTLHYLPPEIRTEWFERFKAATAADGFHVFSVMVHKPFIAAAPDIEPDARLFRSGELMSYYWDWEILWFEESFFDCNSSGVPHRHAVNRMVARPAGA